MTYWQVTIIESERGWGQRIDETIYFDNHVKAEKFVAKYNAHNDKITVPDWYMYAKDPEWISKLPKGAKVRKIA